MSKLFMEISKKQINTKINKKIINDQEEKEEKERQFYED